MERAEGQSLVQVMVAAGVLGVVILATTSMLTVQQKESRALTEKLAALDLEKLLLAALADGTVCTAELSNAAMNPSAPYTLSPTNPDFSIALNSIHAAGVPASPVLVSVGAAASPMSPTLKVSGISIGNFTGAGPPNQYLAELQVSFDAAKLVRPIRPLTIRLGITADASDKITGCLGGAVRFANVSTHPFCNTGFGGSVIKPVQPNRMCTLSAADDDVGSSVNVSPAVEYKCRVASDGTNWRGYAPLACNQVGCVATCFDIQ